MTMQTKSARGVPRSARPAPARPNSAARDVALTWKGRSFVAGAPGGAVRVDGPELVIEETLDGEGPPVRMIRGDALDVAGRLGAEGLAGCVDLVYVDPPYASERSWALEARLDGPRGGGGCAAPPPADARAPPAEP